MAEQLLPGNLADRLLSAADEEIGKEVAFLSGIMPESASETLKEIIETKDFGRLNEVMSQVSGSMDPAVSSRVQNALSWRTFTQQLVPMVQKYDAAVRKEKQGEALTKEEAAHLKLETQLKESVNGLAMRYPSAMKETVSENTSSPEMHTDMNRTNAVSVSGADNDQTNLNTTLHSDSELSYSNPEKEAVSHPREEALTETYSLSDTPIVNHFEQQTEQAGADGRLTPQPGTYRGYSDKDQYDSFTGDTDYLKEGAKEADDRLKAQSGQSNIGDRFNSILNRDTKAYEVVGNDQFKDPQYMKWLPIFESSVFDSLKKFDGSEKEVSDLAVKMLFTALTVPLQFAAEALQQKRANDEVSAQRYKNNREAAIANNLSRHGSSKDDLAIELAHLTKYWVLKDPAYAMIPDNPPYTDLQRALKDKRDFALSLPRKENGDLDYEKMTKKQLKQYQKYGRVLACSETYGRYFCEMRGVPYSKEEFESHLKAALQKQVSDTFYGEEAVERSSVEAPAKNAERKPVSHSETGNTFENGVHFSETKEPRIMPAPEKAASTTVNPTSTMPAPERGAPTVFAPGTTIPGVTPATRSGTTELGVGDSKTLPTPRSATHKTAAENATPSLVNAPTAARSAEEIALEREAQEAVMSVTTSFEPEGVTVSGTLKKPVITTQSGKVIRDAGGQTLADLKEETERKKREAEQLREQQNQRSKEERSVSQTRSGVEQQTSTAGRTDRGNTR